MSAIEKLLLKASLKFEPGVRVVSDARNGLGLGTTVVGSATSSMHIIHPAAFLLSLVWPRSHRRYYFPFSDPFISIYSIVCLMRHVTCRTIVDSRRFSFAFSLLLAPSTSQFCFCLPCPSVRRSVSKRSCSQPLALTP